LVSFEVLEKLKLSKEPLSQSIALYLAHLPFLGLRNKICKYVLNFQQSITEAFRLCNLLNTLTLQLQSSVSFRNILTRCLVFGLYLNRTTRPRMSHGFTLSSLSLLKNVRSVHCPSTKINKSKTNNSDFSFRHKSSVDPISKSRVTLLQLIVKSDPLIFEDFTNQFSDVVDEAAQNIEWLQNQIMTLSSSLLYFKEQIDQMLATNMSEIHLQFAKSFESFFEYAKPCVEQLMKEWTNLMTNTDLLKRYLCLKEGTLSNLVSVLHSILTDFNATLLYRKRRS